MIFRNGDVVKTDFILEQYASWICIETYRDWWMRCTLRGSGIILRAMWICYADCDADGFFAGEK